MRLFLMISNLLAMLALFFLLREEWSRITDYVTAGAVFGGGIALTALNFAYIQATSSSAPRWTMKVREAWGVLRS